MEKILHRTENVDQCRTGSHNWFTY